jgi:hypothetical protein
MMTLPIFTDAEIDKEIEFINHSSKFRLSLRKLFILMAVARSW